MPLPITPASLTNAASSGRAAPASLLRTLGEGEARKAFGLDGVPLVGPVPPPRVTTSPDSNRSGVYTLQDVCAGTDIVTASANPHRRQARHPFQLQEKSFRNTPDIYHRTHLGAATQAQGCHERRGKAPGADFPVETRNPIGEIRVEVTDRWRKYRLSYSVTFT